MTNLKERRSRQERATLARLNSIPVIEGIDLKVNISEIEVSKHFDFITRVIWHVQWQNPNPTWILFGGDAALTNGIQIKYIDDFVLDHGIIDNAHFGAVAYDTRLDQDLGGTKTNVLQSRLSFFRFTKDNRGLHLTNDKRFAIVVQDDLSSSGNDVIEVHVEGWRYYA